ncbi:MAG: polyprenyl synthetase family protein [Desulfuromonadaceae bacterium]|nr:polyprenyl synthetase family protein [Desulfuromonadaceae bacterium]
MEKALRLLRDDLTAVEEHFTKSMHSETALINQVGRYLLASGGKRVRPMLLLLCARLSGYQGSGHIPLASVVEFIHTATLLHDDVVDKATLRRGNPSANVVWGNQASVLAGDYLFAKSFSMIVETGNLPVFQTLSEAATLLAEGEMQQLVNISDLDLKEQSYLEIVGKKTAALFAAACRCGALLVDDGPQAETLRQFGTELGLAFQLIDDALDYVAVEAEFGKTRGHDLAEGKVTLPLIHALRNATDSDRQRIIAVIGQAELPEADLAEVLQIIELTGGIAYCWQQAEELIGRAKERLNSFADGPEKEALFELADYVVARRH